MKKRALVIVLTLIALIGLLVLPAYAACTHDCARDGCPRDRSNILCGNDWHTHVDSCYGFNCTHQHDESCGYFSPSATPAPTPAPSSPFVEPHYYADYEEDAESVPPEPEAAENHFVTCRALNVRAGAGLDRIGVVRRGDVVSVVAWEGDWAKVEWNGAFAYVFGAYITKA